MTDRPIFIFGQPRSGTTMLMRVLNAGEDVRIYGEHGGAAYYLGLIHRSLCKDHVVDYQFDITDEQAEAVLASGKEWCNNLGGIQTDTIRAGLRGLIEAIGNPFHKEVRWGFKEVNIVGRELIDALVELYPNCQIVCLTRNPVDSILSSKRLGWCQDVKEAMVYWCLRTESFMSAELKYPNNCKFLKYESLDSRTVESLLQWLGITMTDAHAAAYLTRVGEAPASEVGLTEAERRFIVGNDTSGLYPNEFEQVYVMGGWDGKGSGVGSSPAYCWDYITFLQHFLCEHSVRSVLDVGCGDWQFMQYLNWDGIDYTGMDVVRDVIDTNRERFIHPMIKFVYGDALVDELPKADLLIVKDVIHHMKHKDVRRMVEISRRYKKVLWVVDMGKEVPHGAWPCTELCAYFRPLPVLFTFTNPPDYPYGRKQVLFADNVVSLESASHPAAASESALEPVFDAAPTEERN
jgi:SAM-dependent methyltransferase